ncbi:hypothetical protein Zm00014a_030957 [Zea mays]|uniref:Uncharacterized protein n=1 Tax=Zea mays TaxID=4577 RepID=A0A3L6E4V2_MAIZE|nr:hypothetical protein Zm00014a_030957 [Zea mays]
MPALAVLSCCLPAAVFSCLATRKSTLARSRAPEDRPRRETGASGCTTRRRRTASQL